MPSKGGKMGMTSYDDLGGHDTMKVAVAVFYNRVTADPELAPWFDGIDLARLRAHQAAFLGAALGGPQAFAGRDLTTAHAGLGITGAAFDRMLGHLEFALRDVGADPGVVLDVLAVVRPLRSSIVAQSRSAG
jgi:hemoglobin